MRNGPGAGAPRARGARTVVTLLLCVALAACTGGGGGSSKGKKSGGVSDLAYAVPDATYLVSVPAASNRPTVSGKVLAWSVAPDLPTGLALDPVDGTISGTPELEVARRAYVVTASGAKGSTTQATVHLSIVLPPRFAYTAGDDDTLSIYRVDPWTGALRFHAFQHHRAPHAGAEEVRVSPDGRFAFVVNRGTPGQDASITSYATDVRDGSLHLVGHVATEPGPHRLALDPSGRFLYACSYTTHLIRSYAIDQASGQLQELGTIKTNTGPERMEVDALGRFLFVTHRPSADLAIFRIDPVTGELSVLVSGFNYYAFTPSDVAVDPLGRFVYFTFEGTNNLVAYEVHPEEGTLGTLQDAPTSGRPRAVAVHPHGGWAYVACETTDELDVFALDPASGRPTRIATVPTGDAPVEVEVDASGHYLYVLDRDSEDIDVFAIDEAAGTLEPVHDIRSRAHASGLSVLRGERPALYAGGTLYALNSGSADVAAYEVRAEDGALFRLDDDALAGGQPNVIAVDPFGRRVFVSSPGEDALHVYAAAADGSLVEEHAPTPLPGPPGGMAVERSGQYLFVSATAGDRLLAFSIDEATGALAQVASVATGAEPHAVSADPTGQFVYVANHGGGPDTIGAYAFLDGQFLSGPIAVSAPGGPGQVAFAPDGRRAYVPLAGAKLLAPYAVDPHSGALSPLAAGALPTEDRPLDIALHPSGRFAFAAIAEASGPGYVAALRVDPATGGLQEVARNAEGLGPRDLCVAPDGRLLYVANEAGDDVSAFAIDPATGALLWTGQWAAGLEPEGLVLAGRLW